MKTTFFLLLSLISVYTFSQTKEEEEVLTLARNKFKWMVEMKIDSLSDVLDDRLTYTHSNGWVQTKSDVLKDFTNGRIVYQKIDVEDLRVRLYNGSAIVNGRGKFTVTASTMQVTYDLMFTETYIFIDRKWKLAARHANKMTQ